MSMRPFTKARFERMSAYQKGFWVYMAGADPDQPNIPKSWEPSKRQRKAYEEGQQHAIQVAQDDP